MSDNVVDLGFRHSGNAVNGVVEELERILQEARAGNIKSVQIVAEITLPSGTGVYTAQHINGDADMFILLGGLTLAITKLSNQIAEKQS